jgi:SAM-dependent methyltransferase
LDPRTYEQNNGFDYEKHVMGIGGVVSLNDADPVALRLKRCLESLVKCSGRVLEIGCGAGRMIKNLKFHCPEIEIHGCDVSYQSIHTAFREIPAGAFAVADVQSLPYTDDSFDIVVGFDIMEHVTDVQRTIAETYRILNKRGRFHLHAPCEGNPFTVYWLLKKIGFRRDLKRIHVGHIQKLTTKGILRLLRTQGYTILNITYSWHFIGQLADLEQYLLMDLKTRHGETLHGLLKPWKFTARLLGLFEDILRYLAIKESQLLKKFPLSMSVHITAQK